jgi:hypothetical protein
MFREMSTSSLISRTHFLPIKFSLLPVGNLSLVLVVYPSCVPFPDLQQCSVYHLVILNTLYRAWALESNQCTLLSVFAVVTASTGQLVCSRQPR